MSIFLSIVRQGNFLTECGNATCYRGRIIEKKQTDNPRQNGNWSYWKWDGTQLKASTSGGAHPPLYYSFSDSQITIGDSLQQVAGISTHTSINWSAAAEILLFGHCIGNKTIYKDIAVLPAGSDFIWRADHSSLHIDERLPPQQSALSYDQAIEEYLYLLNKSILRRLPSDTFAMGLSGGRDSRHILLLLNRHGFKPDQIFSSHNYLNSSGNEIHIAKKLCVELDLDFNVVLPPECRITAETRKNSELSFQTLSHSWGLNLSDKLSRYPVTYDGLNAGILFGRASLTQLLSKQCLDKQPTIKEIQEFVYQQCERVETILHTMMDPELLKAFDFAKAKDNFLYELTKFEDYPNIAQAYLYFNQTIRDTSLFSFQLNKSNEVLCPFDDVDLVNFSLSIPWSISRKIDFQDDAICKDFPDHKNVKFASGIPNAPWRGLDLNRLNREYISFKQLNKTIFNQDFSQKANSKQLALNEIQYACFCSKISEFSEFIHMQVKNQKNIIGSLRGDIQKLERARLNLVESRKKLRQELKKQTALQKRSSNNLQAIKNSASWKIGYVLIKAFSKPGTNTLLLPYRLLKILFSHVNLKRRQQKTTQSKKIDACIPPSPLLVSNQESKHNKPYFLRESIASVNLSELRVAAIVDEFTYNCFKPECNLFQLSPADWQQEIETLRPDLLFVEAAWRGKDDLWTGKIEKVSNELTELILWCRKQCIPTSFWAKEDPYSFNTFLSAAKLFDFVFTADIDCIQQYRDCSPNLNIYCLPFAAQPAIHNPVEKYIRKDKFCFAGSYYNRFPERQQDFETFFDTLIEIKPVDIFDRNYREDQNLFIFPDKYKSSILGDLPHDQIDKAYKGYRFAINMNSIKDSRTMFARRVFELLASNTVVLSNYAKGIHSFFGDLVISSDDGKTLAEKLAPLLNDEIFYRKFRLLGLRKVLEEHTYKDRLTYMANKIWGIQPKELPHVHVLAKAVDNDELNLILASYRRQSYTNKSLLVVLEDSIVAAFPEDKTIRVDVRKTVKNKKIGDVVVNDFVAGFVCGDYYGPNYLMDNILATRYSAAPVIGKGSWYQELAGSVQLQNDRERYSYVDQLPLRSCIFRVSLLNKEGLIGFLDQLSTEEIHHGTCLAIDEFNYCRDCTEKACSIVDDLQQINFGLPLSEIFAEPM